MKKKNAHRLLILVGILVASLLAPYSMVYADDINLDGTVDETEWIWLLSDTSQEPLFDIKWWKDTENLYISIVTDDGNENEDLLEFAFRAKEVDYWIRMKPDTFKKYRESGGDWNGWWKNIKMGLPSDVDIVASETDGKRSYEIKIGLSILGSKANNFPANFEFWLKIRDGPNGPINYYPDSYAGWWFAHDVDNEEKIVEFEEIPTFSVPEIPYGTIMTLITMLAATALFMRRTSSLNVKL